jgi:hypothetical protein
MATSVVLENLWPSMGDRYSRITTPRRHQGCEQCAGTSRVNDEILRRTNSKPSMSSCPPACFEKKAMRVDTRMIVDACTRTQPNLYQPHRPVLDSKSCSRHADLHAVGFHTAGDEYVELPRVLQILRRSLDLFFRTLLFAFC